MAMATLFRRMSKSQLFRSNLKVPPFYTHTHHPKPFINPAQVRSISKLAETTSRLEDMISGTERKYYVFGGKGGLEKSCCAASLAVMFAYHGHPTIVVSTDPAYSISATFDEELTGGALVPVKGKPISTPSPLLALEINPEKTEEDLRSAMQNDNSANIKKIMDSMGLGMLSKKVEELKLGELFDTPPPGLDEALAISKILQLVESHEYSSFTRIVFDIAPTDHTLRLLSLPDFLDTSLGKMMKVKEKIASTAAAFKSVFRNDQPPQQIADHSLEQLRERMTKVRDLFRDSKTTEFIIVTIPTAMAISESSRLCASLKKEKIPVQRLVVNQLLPALDCKCCATPKKDQMLVLDLIKKDQELASLDIVESPLFKVTVSGMKQLKLLGGAIWK